MHYTNIIYKIIQKRHNKKNKKRNEGTPNNKGIFFIPKNREVLVKKTIKINYHQQNSQVVNYFKSHNIVAKFHKHITKKSYNYCSTCYIQIENEMLYIVLLAFFKKQIAGKCIERNSE